MKTTTVKDFRSLPMKMNTVITCLDANHYKLASAVCCIDKDFSDIDDRKVISIVCTSNDEIVLLVDIIEVPHE